MSAPPQTKYLRVGFASPGVLHVQLAREPNNYINMELWKEYESVFDNISAWGDVRAVVVSSKLDNIFTSGLDLQEAGGVLSTSISDSARRAFYLIDYINNFQNAFSAPERCKPPVICAMHGTCIGLATDLALACDVRLVASDAQLAMKQVDIGLASDIGVLARGPKMLASSSLFSELALSGRPFGAEESARLGFASRVVEGSRDKVVAEALKLANLIASRGPVGVASTKRLLLHARDNTVDASLNYTKIWNGAMLQTSDVATSIPKFVKGEEYSFSDFQPISALPRSQSSDTQT